MKLALAYWQPRVFDWCEFFFDSRLPLLVVIAVGLPVSVCEVGAGAFKDWCGRAAGDRGSTACSYRLPLGGC